MSQKTTELIKIYLRLHNGNGSSMSLEKQQSYSQLLQMFDHLNIQLPHSFRVIHRGKEIVERQKTLQELGIIENSILHIEQVDINYGRPEKMDVCIFLKGEKFIIRSSPCEKIITLKQSIYKLSKIKTKDQLLVFEGFILQNNMTLKYYKIKSDSLICLHSTCKRKEFESVYSGCQPAPEAFLLKQNQLLQSVQSVCQQKNISQLNLFRSHNNHKKYCDLTSYYQIQIHQSINDESLSVQKQFNYNLFKKLEISNPMTLNTGYNLFESLRHPFYPSKFQKQDAQNQEIIAEYKVDEEDDFVQSITSFDDF